MKTSKLKKAMGFAAIGLGVVLLTSCTANFCSQQDFASIAYPYDQGVTVYLSKQEFDDLASGAVDPDNGFTKAVIQQEMEWSDEAEFYYGLPRIAGQAYEGNDQIYKYIPYIPTAIVESEGSVSIQAQYFVNFTSHKTDGVLRNVITSAKTSNYRIPSVYYFGIVDDFVLREATAKAFGRSSFEEVASSDIASIKIGSEDDLGSSWTVNPYTMSDPTTDDIVNGKAKEIPATGEGAKSILRRYGYWKFDGIDADGKSKMWGNYDKVNEAIMGMTDTGFEQLGTYQVPGSDFINYYKTQVNTKVSNIRSCIATREGYFGHYGADGDWRVAMEAKDWGYAWSKGFLEGLLVYPVSWLLDTFAYGMDSSLSGMGQIWALVFVTLIVRGLLLLISFRSTMDNQKMQNIQPEIAKLQAKYPNSNSNPTERQRLSQEQMALYRRNGIHPMRQMLLLIVQFPVFICVWSGLQGASTLATGEVLNMRLSDTIQSILFNTKGLPANTYGWWTALVLFILMAIVQIFAMILPRIIAKANQKKLGGKLTANPAQDQQGRTMKWVSYGMMIFTIIMGFLLPSAMGVYWLIGGLISIAQTLITQIVLKKAKKRKK